MLIDDTNTAPIADTTTETPESYSYADLHKETPREILENTELPKPEEKKEEKVEEKPVEPPKDETVEIDVNELTNEAAKKAAEELFQKYKAEEEAKIKAVEDAKAIPTKEQEYVKYANEFKNTNGRDPSWTEAMEFLEDRATKKASEQALQTLEAREQKRQDDYNTHQAQVKQAEDAAVKVFSDKVDRQIEELSKAEKLTRIKDPKNPSDQGIVERTALFQKMYEVNTERNKLGLPPIDNVKEIFYEHYSKPQAQPPGGDAPVNVGKNSSTPVSEEAPLNYIKDIKGKNWNWFRK